MKNYYEVLGIRSDASAVEIKKAYFSMVRKYPPDRFQEEFMQIREAYETLSNEKTKKQYDSILNLSPEIRETLNFARDAMKQGDFKEAIQYLEQILGIQGDNLMIKALLGEAYLNNGNSGKAVKIFENLVELEPKNASFLGRLANAYLARGWQKRAIKMFEKALELDEDNLSLLLGYSQALIDNRDYCGAREAIVEGIEKVKENNLENTALYMQLIMLDLMQHRLEEMESHIDELISLAKEAEDIKDNVGWTLAQLARAMMQTQLANEAVKLIEKVAKLLPEDKNIAKIKEEMVNFQRIENVFQDFEMDDDFDDQLVSLIALEIFPDGQLDLNIMERKTFILLNETMLLEEIRRFKPMLRKLREKYPELYNVKKEFFDSALNPVKYKKLYNEHKKQKQEMQWLIDMLTNKARMQDILSYEENYEDDDYSDEYFEIQEPFVREEPKVGRNDPCPCGSGKKYKKCCGR